MIPPVRGPDAVPVKAGGGRPESWRVRRGQGGTRRLRLQDTGPCQGRRGAGVGHTSRAERRWVWRPPLGRPSRAPH